MLLKWATLSLLRSHKIHFLNLSRRSGFFLLLLKWNRCLDFKRLDFCPLTRRSRCRRQPNQQKQWRQYFSPILSFKTFTRFGISAVGIRKCFTIQRCSRCNLPSLLSLSLTLFSGSIFRQFHDLAQNIWAIACGSHSCSLIVFYIRVRLVDGRERCKRTRSSQRLWYVYINTEPYQFSRFSTMALFLTFNSGAR